MDRVFRRRSRMRSASSGADGLPADWSGHRPVHGGDRVGEAESVLSVQLKKLVTVDAVKYSYFAYFQIISTWRDPRVNDTLAINNAVNAFGPAITGLATAKCMPGVTFSGFNISQKDECLKTPKQNNLPQMDGCSKPCTPSGTMCCDSIWIPSLTIDNVLFYPQDRFQTESIYFFGQYSNEASAIDREVVVGGEFSSPLSFKKFPLDSQTLRLSIQVQSGEFYLVGSNSGRQSEQGGGQLGGGGGTYVNDEVTGWKINGVALNCTPSDTTVSTSATYHPDDPWYAFSQNSPSDSGSSNANESTSCVFTIQISRTSGVYIISIVVPVMLSVYLCFSVFFARPDDLETRSATFVTLFLALSAVQFVIDSQLPRSSVMTQFGYLVIISYVFISLTAVETLIVYLIADRLEKDVVETVGDMAEGASRALQSTRNKPGSQSPQKVDKACAFVPGKAEGGGEESQELCPVVRDEEDDEEVEEGNEEAASGGAEKFQSACLNPEKPPLQKSWHFSLFGYHLKHVDDEHAKSGNYLLAARIDFVCCTLFFIGYTLTIAFPVFDFRTFCLAAFIGSPFVQYIRSGSIAMKTRQRCAALPASPTLLLAILITVVLIIDCHVESARIGRQRTNSRRPLRTKNTRVPSRRLGSEIFDGIDTGGSGSDSGTDVAVGVSDVNGGGDAGSSTDTSGDGGGFNEADFSDTVGSNDTDSGGDMNGGDLTGDNNTDSGGDISNGGDWTDANNTDSGGDTSGGDWTGDNNTDSGEDINGGDWTGGDNKTDSGGDINGSDWTGDNNTDSGGDMNGSDWTGTNNTDSGGGISNGGEWTGTNNTNLGGDISNGGDWTGTNNTDSGGDLNGGNWTGNNNTDSGGDFNGGNWTGTNNTESGGDFNGGDWAGTNNTNSGGDFNGGNWTGTNNTDSGGDFNGGNWTGTNNTDSGGDFNGGNWTGTNNTDSGGDFNGGNWTGTNNTDSGGDFNGGNWTGTNNTDSGGDINGGNWTGTNNTNSGGDFNGGNWTGTNNTDSGGDFNGGNWTGNNSTNSGGDFNGGNWTGTNNTDSGGDFNGGNWTGNNSTDSGGGGDGGAGGSGDGGNPGGGDVSPPGPPMAGDKALGLAPPQKSNVLLSMPDFNPVSRYATSQISFDATTGAPQWTLVNNVSHVAVLSPVEDQGACGRVPFTLLLHPPGLLLPHPSLVLFLPGPPARPRSHPPPAACWAFAAAAAVEAAVAIFTATTPARASLSAQQLLDCAPGTCMGGYPEDALQYSSTALLRRASQYPYIMDKSTCRGGLQVSDAELVSWNRRARTARTASRTLRIPPDPPPASLTRHSSAHPPLVPIRTRLAASGIGGGAGGQAASAVSHFEQVALEGSLGPMLAVRLRTGSPLTSAHPPPPSPPVSQQAASMVSHFEQVALEGSLGLMLAVRQQPVVVSILASAPDFVAYKSGIYSNATCFSPSNPVLDHVVLVVGFHFLSAASDENYFIIRNSWGSKWGEGGHMRIAMTSAYGGMCGMTYQRGLYPTIKASLIQDPCKLAVCGGGTCTRTGVGRYTCDCPSAKGLLKGENKDGTETCIIKSKCSLFASNPCGMGACVDGSSGEYSCGVECNPLKPGTRLRLTPPDTTRTCTTRYPISKADSLAGSCDAINSRFGIRITDLNPGLDCTKLQPGQQVCIEWGTAVGGSGGGGGTYQQCTQYHAVGPNDTCDSILQSNPSLSWRSLYRLNVGLLCDNLNPLRNQEVCVGATPLGAIVCDASRSRKYTLIHARHRSGPEIAVADATQPHSRSLRGGDAASSHRQFDSQSPEVGASGARHPSSSSVEGATRSTTGAGSGGAESIAEWKRRSAEAGAHFFPLQRAEDAPSREEIHRRILAPKGLGEGLKGNVESSRASDVTYYPLPLKDYDSTLLSTANGTMGNTMVNYSTTVNEKKIPLVVYPYYVNLKLGSQKQEFSMAINLVISSMFVPCDCLHCGSMRKGTTYSKPFSTLASTTLKYISCADQRCMGGTQYGYFGCNTQGLSNYLDTTGLLPGDDALCVFDAKGDVGYDYYEADYYEAGSRVRSVGHVVEDTVYLTAPDGTEVNRSIIFGCGVNQQGYWGMQGWQYGSWAAGGVLGLGQYSPFLWQLTGPNDPSTLALCLEKPTPTNETGWDGKVPLQTGSSHLTIGATGLPAGASYATMDSYNGMQYSEITLTLGTGPDDFRYITDDYTNLYRDPADPITPGFFFMPESFVHLLRYPLFMSLVDGLKVMTGHNISSGKNDFYRLPCFTNKNKAEDPFTTFPTIDIAFFSPNSTNATSHFYLKPREYLAQVSASEYCVLVTYMLSQAKYASYIGEPGLLGKYLFLDYTNATAGWIDAPTCGAEPLLPPPSPPPPSPPSPVSKAATRPLSPVPAALSAALVLATSTALLALTLL
ncbi:unnamed protein product [Closterium sp. Yama58-4]|nr:unnamed protein product [Closterium sp. Yama58-4]